ncbi:methyltransferase [Paraburkholderia sp. EG287A]|uniref:methyltransferase n=1 Tax=Paraburkholderia sp. EG287A TaxID=3237012 RepID=UPI0034D2C16E
MPARSVAHLRFRHARREEERLGYVPTPPAIVDGLLEHLPQESRRIVDLGAGDGRLARAALDRCPDARALLVEADQGRARGLADASDARSTVLALDLLRDPTLHDMAGMFGTPDAIVSNPPYFDTQLARTDIERVQRVFPFLADAAGWLRADIAFLAHAWALSGVGTFLGFILPAPALTHARYRPLRELLLTHLGDLRISQLPARVFPRVEVDAFLVTGRRAAAQSREATLRQLDGEGRVVGEMTVGLVDGIERLDFSAHAPGGLHSFGGAALTGDTLATLGVHITRGSLTRTAFARVGLDAFHTTHFAAARGGLTLAEASTQHKMAQAGDLLIPRVGSRCLLREARVAAGAGVFSDSVYRLRGAPAVMDRVWATMASDFGRRWRAARAVGSCAKHLPLRVLRDMPVL